MVREELLLRPPPTGGVVLVLGRTVVSIVDVQGMSWLAISVYLEVGSGLARPTLA